MSRNSKTRYAAEQLPPYPQLYKGKIQRDSAGNIIYVNHFRVLKDIQSEMKKRGYGPKHEKTAQEWLRYCQIVLAYNRRAERKSLLQQITIYTILILVAIAVVEIQRKLNVKLF